MSLCRGAAALKETEEGFQIASETERLIIRPLQKDDYENWLNEFEARHPSLNRHDSGKIDMSECTREWFHQLVDKYQRLALSDTAHVFDIFRKSDGRNIGTVDFSTLARDDFQWGRIGYTMHNQHWKKGYGSEAVKEALSMAFHQLKFHRIEAHINLDNTASIKLAQSAGMAYECTRKGFIYENGEWTDHLIYVKTAD
ncbi:GNAT family N-acetyltransferase [Metabacillus sp. SLBN-84]